MKDLSQGCQTCIAMVASHDISRLFSPLLNRAWLWATCDTSGPRAASPDLSKYKKCLKGMRILMFYLFTWWAGIHTQNHNRVIE